MLLWISVFSFSQIGLTQNEYPKILVKGQDTLVVITMAQMDKANVVKIQRDRFEELYLNKEQENSDQQLVIVRLGELTASQKEELRLATATIEELRTLTGNLEADVKAMAADRDRQEKRKKFWKGVSVVTGTATVILAAILALVGL